MSRVHPGQSNAYNNKMRRREERQYDRYLLKLAKKKFFQMFGNKVPIDRVKIRRYKKEFRMQNIPMPEDEEVDPTDTL